MTDYISNRPWEKKEVELSQEDVEMGDLVSKYYADSSNNFVDSSIRFPDYKLEPKKYRNY